MNYFVKQKQKSFDKAIEHKDIAKKEPRLGSHSKIKTMDGISSPKVPRLSELNNDNSPENKADHEEYNSELQIESSSRVRRKNSTTRLTNGDASGQKLISSLRKSTFRKTNTIAIINEPQQIQANSSSVNFRSQMLKFKTMKEGDIIGNIMSAERECDNDYETNDCFLKLKMEEFNTAYCTIITIISTVFYYEYTNFPNELLINEKPIFCENLRKFCLGCVLISSILFSKIYIKFI